jgi:uncharacterized SAM-binding protein YcdF (DUF218 family)
VTFWTYHDRFFQNGYPNFFFHQESSRDPSAHITLIVMNTFTLNFFFHQESSRDPSANTFSFVLVFIISIAIIFFFSRYYKSQRASYHPFDAILILGGNKERELASAAFCSAYPNIPVFVSSGYAEKCWFNDPSRVTIDRRATDTLSNFTTLISTFKNCGFAHILVLTDEPHSRRSMYLGMIVLGAVGLGFSLRTVPLKTSLRPSTETSFRLVRDVARAVCWVLTGFDGRNFGRAVHPERFRHLTMTGELRE